jgi:multidrug efflux system outer membrane protein
MISKTFGSIGASNALLSVLLLIALQVVSLEASSRNRHSGPDQKSANVEITPENLRHYLLNNNISVLTALNNVYQAKEGVNKARADLLPSLNLGIGVAPSFALNTVSFLLPFLVPSNWYALDASKHQLAANGFAYYIVELNAYASAFSVYMTVLGDVELRGVYEKQYENFVQIHDIVAGNVRIGTDTLADLAQASSQMELARAQVSQIDELLIQEKASLRSMLGLSLKTNITFSKYHLPSVPEENSSAESIYQKVWATTPEQNQIASLIAAAKDAVWAASWGWLGSSSLAVGTGQGASSFGKVSVGTPINLGFGIFPAINLSNLNVAQLKIRQKGIALEEASAIESILGSVGEAKIQLTQSSSAESDSQTYLNDTLGSYRIGTTDLLHVFGAANTATISGVTRAKAQIDVDNQRIGLNRILISNQFKGIPTCSINVAPSGGGVFGWLGRILSGGGHTTSVDVICRPTAHAEAVASGS